MTTYASRYARRSEIERVDYRLVAGALEALDAQAAVPSNRAVNLARWGYDAGDEAIYFTRRWEYPYALEATAVREGERVLDIGGSVSPLPLLLAARGCRVAVADPYFRETWALYAGGAPFDGSPAARLVAALGIEVREDGGLDGLPFPDGSFDVVLCVSVIEHVAWDTALRGLAEASRVLAPAGRAAFTVDILGAGAALAAAAKEPGAPLFAAAGLEVVGPVEREPPPDSLLRAAPPRPRDPIDPVGPYDVFGFALRKRAP